MRTSKQFLIGLISIVFVCGAVALVTPSAEQAEATGFFGKFKKGTCAVPPTWGEMAALTALVHQLIVQNRGAAPGEEG